MWSWYTLPAKFSLPGLEGLPPSEHSLQICCRTFIGMFLTIPLANIVLTILFANNDSIQRYRPSHAKCGKPFVELRLGYLPTTGTAPASLSEPNATAAC